MISNAYLAKILSTFAAVLLTLGVNACSKKVEETPTSSPAPQEEKVVPSTEETTATAGTTNSSETQTTAQSSDPSSESSDHADESDSHADTEVIEASTPKSKLEEDIESDLNELDHSASITESNLFDTLAEFSKAASALAQGLPEASSARRVYVESLSKAAKKSEQTLLAYVTKNHESFQDVAWPNDPIIENEVAIVCEWYRAAEDLGIYQRYSQILSEEVEELEGALDSMNQLRDRLLFRYMKSSGARAFPREYRSIAYLGIAHELTNSLIESAPGIFEDNDQKVSVAESIQYVKEQLNTVSCELGSEYCDPVQSFYSVTSRIVRELVLSDDWTSLSDSLQSYVMPDQIHDLEELTSQVTLALTSFDLLNVILTDKLLDNAE